MKEFSCKIISRPACKLEKESRTLVCDAKSNDRKRWNFVSLDIMGKNRRQITAFMRKARQELSAALS
jgi:hypothetical protein